MSEALALTEQPSTSIAQANALEPFEALYVQHRTAVFRYARARSINDDDAADLTAVVFERALVAWPRYRPTGGGELAWLFRIARNAAIDDARRRRLAGVLSPTAVRGMLAIGPPPPGDRNYFRIFVRVGGRSIDGLTHGEIEGTDPLLLPFDSVAGFDDPGATGTVEVQAMVPPDGDTSKTFIPVETWIIPIELR